jgi:hypothetical protein
MNQQSYSTLFIGGFLQVFFVVINTYFITKGFILGIIVASFIISWIWASNVKRIAISTNIDKLVYCLGATSGSVIGYFIGTLILK